jgi:ActD protein
MSSSSQQATGIYGLMAEFKTADDLLHAAGRTYREGYRAIDAFSPVPIHGLAEAMGQNDRTISKIVLGGGLMGCLGGYSLAYWTSAIDYPLNIGGRPLHSWPAFIVPTFETTILLAAISAVVGMLALNGLPMPYHPVFNVPRFALASRDRYFLVIESRDPKFDRDAVHRLLTDLHATEVADVEH